MAGERTNGSTEGFESNDGDEPVILDETGSINRDADDDAIPPIDLATVALGEPDGDEQPRKRRGRKPGTRNSSTKASKQASADLTQLLMSTHFMLSVLCKVPELEIEEPEAKRISEAVNRLNELYGGVVIPEKAQAWLNLGIAAGTVYGPRFVAHSVRIKNERKNQPVTIDAEPIMRPVN
jgi:hypothetical protein